MIYTVTLNPALDYRVGVENLKMGMTNKAAYETLTPGGKGLNVSLVLDRLGTKNIALGFIAGFTGEEIRKRYQELGGRDDFIELKNGSSRINIKIKNETETEINASGPEIDTVALEQLQQKLDVLREGDILILAGSVPSSMPKSLYADIMTKIQNRGVLTVVDATGELLTGVLPHKPFLVKPNNYELGELFGVELKSLAEVVPYAKRLKSMGAANVLVSMAGEGAVLVTENDEALMCKAPIGEVKNSVGAGDSMVAGFIAGWLDSMDFKHALKMGVAAGSAAAFSDYLPTKDEIERVYKKLKIE